MWVSIGFNFIETWILPLWDIHAIHCATYPTVYVVITQLMRDAIYTVHETQGHFVTHALYESYHTSNG